MTFLLSKKKRRSFDEAHAALSEGFGGPLAIPADVLLLWSALGLDAGEPLKVAAALSSFLDASTVPGGAGRGAAGPAAPPPSGPVLGPDQFEAAARMLLCEALIKEARSPAAARAWVAAGGAARSGLPAARAAALAAEVEAAASAAEASESLAGEMVERSVVFSSRRGASASGNGEGKEEEEKRQRATAAAAVTAPLAASSPAPVDASAALLPSGSKGSTVALGTGMRGGVVLRSTSFIASTPDRLAELWSSGSGGSGGEAPATDEAALSSAARRQRWPTVDGPPFSSPLSSSIPASIYSVQAAAAAALGAVVAYAAFAERRSLARAGRSGLRALASTLGLALRVTPA